MAKRFFIKIGWGLTTTTAVLALVLATGLLRYWYADNSLTNYEQAKACPTQDNCRERIAATISKSVSIYIDFAKTGKARPFHNELYKLSIFLPEFGNRSVEIIPNKKLIFKDFDIENIFVPSGANSGFARANFPEDKMVYVEVWRDRITFLFMDSVDYNPANLTADDQNSNSDQGQVMVSSTPPDAYNIAIPTSKHPAILAENAQNNLILLAGLFGLSLLAFLLKALFVFIKDLQKKYGAQK